MASGAFNSFRRMLQKLQLRGPPQGARVHGVLATLRLASELRRSGAVVTSCGPEATEALGAGRWFPCMENSCLQAPVARSKRTLSGYFLRSGEETSQAKAQSQLFAV